MRVLVTGGAGFIGSAVIDRLAGSALQPVVYDVAADPLDDVTDLARVRPAARGCDAVVHLAAKVGLGVDVRDIDDYAWRNDYGTAVVLRAAAENDIGRVVFASSMVVYGEGAYRCARHGPTRPAARRIGDLDAGIFDPTCPRCGGVLSPELVPESAALDPRNVYAATKVHGEHLASAWARETSGRVAALRLHNVYGPGLPRDTPYAGVAALFGDRLAAGRPAEVFEDGEQRRNFVHVDDVAEAVVATCTAPLAAGLTPVNIGSDRVTTVGQMARALTEAIGGPEPVITGRYRLGDVRHITADCRSAVRLLGWRARVPLDQGVASMVGLRSGSRASAQASAAGGAPAADAVDVVPHPERDDAARQA